MLLLITYLGPFSSCLGELSLELIILYLPVLQASTPRTEVAESAAVDIARYIRAVPSVKRQDINVTLYRVLIAVDEVTVEQSVTVSYHEEEGVCHCTLR